MARKRYREGKCLASGAVLDRKIPRGSYSLRRNDRRVRKAVVLGSKREIPTKRLAEHRSETYLAPINAFSYRPGKMATVGEFAEKWKRETLSNRKASTVHGYESHLKVQILPHLGKLPLDQVGVENQQAFIRRIAGTVSRTTLRNVLATLSSMLTTAKNWGYTCEGVHFNKLALPERDSKETGAHVHPGAGTRHHCVSDRTISGHVRLGRYGRASRRRDSRTAS